MPNKPLFDRPSAAVRKRRKYQRELHQRKMALKATFDRLGISGFDSHRSLTWLSARIRDASPRR